MKFFNIFILLFSLLLLDFQAHTSCKNNTNQNVNILPISSFVKVGKIFHKENPKEKDKKEIYISSGSGFIVKIENDLSKAFILTAGHICLVEHGYILDGFNIQNVSGYRFEAEIVSVNIIKEICILTTTSTITDEQGKNAVGEVIQISKKEPILGEKVFNIAAPRWVY